MADLDKILEQIKELTVVETSDLVKKLEEEFDISPMAITPAATTAAEDADTDNTEEKRAYNIEVTDAGEKKINVIKALREFRQDLGLKDAKELIDNIPSVVAENMPTEEAQEAKKKLEEAGATVELK